MPSSNALRLLAPFAALIASSALAQDPSERFQRLSVQVGETTVAYGVYVPDDLTTQDEYPVIIALAGSGASGNDGHLTGPTASTWVTDDSQREDPAFVIAPAYPANFDPNVYFPDVIGPALLAVLDGLAAAYPIDADRLYITGLSLGAMAAWAYMYVPPMSGRFAAALLMSGQWVLPDPPTVNDTPVWVLCGAFDSLVGDVRDMVGAVENSGIEVVRLNPAWDDVGLTVSDVDELNANGRRHIYSEVSGWGHGPWLPLYDDPAIHHWLFSQVRPASTGREHPPDEPVQIGLTTFPNPFDGVATIEFEIPEPSHVIVEIMDALGRKVVEPARGLMAPGVQRLQFSAGPLTPGLYLVRLTAGEHSLARVMVLAR